MRVRSGYQLGDDGHELVRRVDGECFEGLGAALVPRMAQIVEELLRQFGEVLALVLLLDGFGALLAAFAGEIGPRVLDDLDLDHDISRGDGFRTGQGDVMLDADAI